MRCDYPTFFIPALVFASISLGAASCGGIGSPGAAEDPSVVPAQAVNDSTLGLIRIRLANAQKDRELPILTEWFASGQFGGEKFGDLIHGLGRAGFETMIVAVPGDWSFVEDTGFYVGGPSETISVDDVERVLLKSGGFGIAGGLAGSLVVTELGNGWFFIGIEGDGVIEGSSRSAASRFSDVLRAVGDHALCIVLPMDFLDEALEDAPKGPQSRFMRRLGDLTEALSDADALALVSSTASDDLQLVAAFPTEWSAGRLVEAVEGARSDFHLMIDGDVERGAIKAEEAAADRALVNSLKVTQEGRAVRFGR